MQDLLVILARSINIKDLQCGITSAVRYLFPIFVKYLFLMQEQKRNETVAIIGRFYKYNLVYLIDSVHCAYFP